MFGVIRDAKFNFTIVAISTWDGYRFNFATSDLEMKLFRHAKPASPQSPLGGRVKRGYETAMFQHWHKQSWEQQNPRA